MSTINRKAVRAKVHRRIRRKLSGTASRPRLAVYFSNRHVYAQIIDDSVGHTLASASTVEKEIASQVQDMTKTEAAKLIGKIIAQRAQEKGIKQVVFDRGGYLYTGRVAAVAESAREAGLEF